eukprot:gene33963-43873_t
MQSELQRRRQLLLHERLGFENIELPVRASTPWDAMKMKGQVNEVQLLTCTATTGTFTLFYNGKPSKAIPYNANAVTVTQALLSIGPRYHRG